MTRTAHLIAILLGSMALLISGCTAFPAASGDGQSDEVAQKALEVGQQIGIEDGFGGSMMSGYLGHAPSRMGFNSADDLAASGETLTVELSNQVGMPCNFRLNYLASQIDLSEHIYDVTVNEDETITVEIPCSEIVGLGSLTDASEVAAEIDDGASILNPFAVPGFLGLDYECGGRYGFVVKVDTDDLDGDGDITEYIAISSALVMHLQNGGPGGHRHGGGMGMMGQHGMMGFGG